VKAPLQPLMAVGPVPEKAPASLKAESVRRSMVMPQAGKRVERWCRVSSPAVRPAARQFDRPYVARCDRRRSARSALRSAERCAAASMWRPQRLRAAPDRAGVVQQRAQGQLYAAGPLALTPTDAARARARARLWLNLRYLAAMRQACE
jgi:hypothetical protein